MPLPAIDVVIPAIEKDLGTLPHVIDSVRKMVKHPIGKFMIVSPDTPRMRRLCKQKNCSFINENTVLPITKKNIHYRSAKWERSGWLFQQLLKLGSSKLGANKYYLVIDADTILIRPHAFLTESGLPIFYYRNWSQPEYYQTYRKLMGRKHSSKTSFVTHYMLFESAKVSQLKRTIEQRHGIPWYQAIIRSINMKKQFGFSEFETYGNFLRDKRPGSLVMKPALNKSLSMSASRLTEAKRLKLARSYRSVSFHHRKGYVRK
ncbi:DUF6492 family protein [Paenibacillus nasutitermitis]|uniref:Uncharacterized protein n=1 Tax=Paenibacillus nasutitermitis TaxID=1652958 RepID=A0A916ZE92_9BACL|nr:DUF6492 family protein [Paenibacillus nasutitermitis]GGD90066.1 hypothetical protein GCM10010911_55870 [Paenibacillus nasutitermitis]